MHGRTAEVTAGHRESFTVFSSAKDYDLSYLRSRLPMRCEEV